MPPSESGASNQKPSLTQSTLKHPTTSRRPQLNDVPEPPASLDGDKQETIRSGEQPCRFVLRCCLQQLELQAVNHFGWIMDLEQTKKKKKDEVFTTLNIKLNPKP